MPAPRQATSKPHCSASPARGALRRVFFVLVALTLPACASINPILAPARVLGPGRVAVDLGSAYNAPVAESTLREAREADERISRGVGSAQDRDALVRGALLYGAAPPGVGTYVSARAGFGNGFEGQLALAGRVGRVGVRRVFWTDEVWALSLGVQGRFAFVAAALEGPLRGLSVSESRLFGGDASMVIGRTSSDLYDLWLGVRAGFTYGNGTMALAQTGTSFDAEGARFDLSGVLGIRVGFGRIAALMELETTFVYAWASSSTGVSASGTALVLVPAASLAYAF